MGPEPAGEEVESAVVAADLVGAEEDAVLVADEKLPCRIAARTDLADHPSRGAAVEHQVGMAIEQGLQAVQVFWVPAHVSPDPRMAGVLTEQIVPHAVV